MRMLEDRIELMHIRAKKIKRKSDLLRIAAYGAASLVLLICLIAFTLLQSGTLHGIDSFQLTGASMLDTSVGGYVLVAVLSFMIAVLLTLLCFNWKNKKNMKRFDDVEDELHI